LRRKSYLSSTICEVGRVEFQLNLDAETVAQAYPREPSCVEPTATVREVLALMKEKKAGAILVCDPRQEGRLVGVFTERDALRLMAGGFAGAGSNGDEHAGGLDAPIERVMTPRPTTLAATDTVGRAITMMSAGGYRRLPIADASGKPVGVVEAAGILHYLAEHFPKVVFTLPPAPHHATQTREGA
jgi:CBS domain-containing protein